MSSTGYVYSQYGVDSSSKGRANELQAAITREMWDDYQTTFEPYLSKMTDAASFSGQKKMTDELVTGIKNNYQGLAQRSDARSDRMMGRYGLKETGRESASSSRMSALNAAAGLNRDTTNARIDASNRVESLLTGGALSKEELTQ